MSPEEIAIKLICLANSRDSDGAVSTVGEDDEFALRVAARIVDAWPKLVYALQMAQSDLLDFPGRSRPESLDNVDAALTIAAAAEKGGRE